MVGEALGLPDSMVYRQPFPGPGLGVRCLGAITRDRLEAVRESDAILREEFAAAGLEGKVWQYFTRRARLHAPPACATACAPSSGRSIIRAVNTVDAMTAEVPELDWALLKKITAAHLERGPRRLPRAVRPDPEARAGRLSGNNVREI